MDVYSIRLANYLNLKRTRAENKTSRVAELADTDPNYLTQIERNLQKKQIGTRLARKLEKGFGLPRGYLDQDHGGSDRDNTEPGRPLRRVPEFSWVQAGAWNGIEDFRETYAEHPQVVTDKPVGPRAFALRVRGDSMTNPSGWPTYPDGCRVIVDPDIEAKAGMRVVVRLDGVDEATFKELAYDSGRYLLKPLNPRYPMMPLPEGARIVGVVIQTVMDE